MIFGDPDALIESLLYDLAVKDEQIVCLNAERDSYRLLSQVAIGAFADATQERDKALTRNRQLVAQMAALTTERRDVAA